MDIMKIIALTAVYFSNIWPLHSAGLYCVDS